MDQKGNDMLERMKIAAQQTAQAVGKAADVAGKKTNELVSTTKASLQIFDLNSEIDGLLKEIGRCVYMAHTGSEVHSEEIDARIRQIDAKYQEIARLKAEIEQQKATPHCPQCGKACAKGDAYCSACGHPIGD